MSAPFSVENARERHFLCLERVRETRDQIDRLIKDVGEEQDVPRRARMLLYVGVLNIRKDADERSAALYLEAAEKP